MIKISTISKVREDTVKLLQENYNINLSKESGWSVEEIGPNNFRLKRFISKGIMSWTPLFYHEGELKELDPPMHT